MKKSEHSFSNLMWVMTFVFLSCIGCNSNPRVEEKNDGEKTSPALENPEDSKSTADIKDSVGDVSTDPSAAPEIELEHVFQGPSAERVNLKELRGNVVVLDYWATW